VIPPLRAHSNQPIMGGRCCTEEGSIRQSQHLMLARPHSRRIEEASDSDPLRQSTFDSGFDEARRKEGQRDSHVDVTLAAGLPCGDAFDCGSAGRSDVAAVSGHRHRVAKRLPAAAVGFGSISRILHSVAAPIEAATTGAPQWPRGRRGRIPDWLLAPERRQYRSVRAGKPVLSGPYCCW
jgi:hypothetical protein